MKLFFSRPGKNNTTTNNGLQVEPRTKFRGQLARTYH